MSKVFTSFFRIQKGEIINTNVNNDELQKFIEANEGKQGTREYRIEGESVKHSQHKYYRGYLIPPIARECFDNDEYRAHIEMKKMFLFRDCGSYEKIPPKLRGRCIPMWRVNPDGEEILVGYLPSTGDITKKEMDEYILVVEKFSFEMAMNDIPPDGVEIRNKIFSSNET